MWVTVVVHGIAIGGVRDCCTLEPLADGVTGDVDEVALLEELGEVELLAGLERVDGGEPELLQVPQRRRAGHGGAGAAAAVLERVRRSCLWRGEAVAASRACGGERRWGFRMAGVPAAAPGRSAAPIGGPDLLIRGTSRLRRMAKRPPAAQRLPARGRANFFAVFWQQKAHSAVGLIEMATGTYPSGIGHPYPYPLELSFTRRVTRTRTRVGKCFHTRTRRVIYTRRVTRTRKAYPRITYKYHIFI